MACGVEVELSVRQGYREMKNNLAIARRFGAALEALGRPARETDPRVGSGSTDMGDLSQAVPSIHPYLAICNEGETLCHQHAFAECACSERGFDTFKLRPCAFKFEVQGGRPGDAAPGSRAATPLVDGDVGG